MTSSYYVKINGTTLSPQPKADGGLSVSYQDVHSADSGRDESGSMHFKVVARKIKLQFKFPPMTASQASTILGLINDPTFDVTFFDLETNAARTITCYKGDRSSDWYSFVIAHAHLNGLSFNVIEV